MLFPGRPPVRRKVLYQMVRVLPSHRFSDNSLFVEPLLLINSVSLESVCTPGTSAGWKCIVDGPWEHPPEKSLSAHRGRQPVGSASLTGSGQPFGAKSVSLNSNIFHSILLRTSCKVQTENMKTSALIVLLARKFA